MIWYIQIMSKKLSDTHKQAWSSSELFRELLICEQPLKEFETWDDSPA